MTTQWRTPKIVSMAVYYDGNHEKKFDVGWTTYAWWKSYIMIKTVIEEYPIGKRPLSKIV